MVDMPVRSSRAQLTLLAALLIGSLALAGCGAPPSTLPKTGDGLTKVSVVLDWYPWANHSGLFLA